MTLHPALKDALKNAVTRAGQPESVAKRLEAWLDKLSDGSTHIIEEPDETRSRLSQILDAISIRDDA
jgi:alkanesulfonate monooxygenase SsuD/methylene tetrahydromethanopterin reductase-like flavin-dependent oxidoreductase (luciferase family)